MIFDLGSGFASSTLSIAGTTVGSFGTLIGLISGIMLAVLALAALIGVLTKH